MKFYLHQYLSLISFLIIPLVIFWNPSWLSLMGYQAYWPIFWLLPWALIHGSFKSIIFLKVRFSANETFVETNIENMEKKNILTLRKF